MVQTSLVAVTQGTPEEKGQLGFDKKNLGFKIKRTLCFRPALLRTAWLCLHTKTLQGPPFQLRWDGKVAQLSQNTCYDNWRPPQISFLKTPMTL